MIDILTIRPSVEVMRDFDALPKSVREAIAKANFAHDPAIVAARLGKPAAAIAVIQRLDASWMQSRDPSSPRLVALVGEPVTMEIEHVGS